MKCPVHGAVLGEQEKENIKAVADREWYTSSIYTAEFEKRMREYIGMSHSLFVNSGSSANLLALSALADHQIPAERRICQGDEVITTAISFATTVAPIVQIGAVPVFVDIEPDFTVSIAKVTRAVTPRTKAIVLTHTMGVPINADILRRYCNAFDYWLIEDTCDALGSRVGDGMAGSYGHFSTFSFFPAHTITTGEGGMLMTDDPKLFHIARSYRDWGRDCWCKPGQDNACGHRFDSGYDHKHTHYRMGYNLKATDMQAAIGVAQMDRLHGFIDARRRNYQYLYTRNIQGYDTLPLLPGCVPFGFPLMTRNGNRAEVCQWLEKRGVGVRMIFGGDPAGHPAYKHIRYRTCGDLEQTKKFHARGLWVGCWPGLTIEQLDYIANTLEEYGTCKQKIEIT